MIEELERQDVILLGRRVGTGTSWDQMDTAVFGFYDFVPVVTHNFVPMPQVLIPKCDFVSIDYETGHWEAYMNDKDGPVAKGDLIEAIGHVEKVKQD